MAASSDSSELVSPGADALIKSVVQAAGEQGEVPGLNLWLRLLIERHAGMAQDLAPKADPAKILASVREELACGRTGAPLAVFGVLEEALVLARLRGLRRAYESDLARVILAKAGHEVLDPVMRAAPSEAASDMDGEEKESPNPPPAKEADAARDEETGIPLTTASASTIATPTLDQFGRDLTRLAREGKLGPVVGRDEETELVIETLCRRTTRNPVLVGPAGVGKTAIVEGLAQRLATGRAPALLQGVRVVELQASALVAGARFAGELEDRVKKIVREASQPSLVLFVDEVHALMGTGGHPGLSDVATQLKPALARGDIACIAATTDDEYRRFIESDKALERRFQPVRIDEPTAEQTLAIVARLAEELERSRGVAVPAPTRRWIVDFSQQFLRNRYFPAKAVDLLEQCVAHAIVRGRAACEVADAEEVGQRLIGMPVDLATRRANLARRLEREALLPRADREMLLARLEVTMASFDFRAERPNAVVLLAGEEVAAADPLCRAIAESLFGSPQRVVAMDFARFVHPEDITMLIGAPPGYVGYSEALEIHRLVQTPWCVFRCDNVHACHPRILEELAQALESGYFTDSRGRRVHLSDTVVVLTAAVETKETKALGFKAPPAGAAGAPRGLRRVLEGVLGQRLVTQCDTITCGESERGQAGRESLEQAVLGPVGERFRRAGLDLHWDPSVVEWLLSMRRDCGNELEWERVVDQRLGAHLVRYEHDTHGSGERKARVRCENGALHIEAMA